MAQVVACLPSKHAALRSATSTSKKKKNEELNFKCLTTKKKDNWGGGYVNYLVLITSYGTRYQSFTLYHINYYKSKVILMIKKYTFVLGFEPRTLHLLSACSGAELQPRFNKKKFFNLFFCLDNACF